MEIEPEYVTLDQAKWLKEKGFNIKSNRFFDLISNIEMDNAPLGNYNLTNQGVSIPEQWKVVEWLKDNQDIWVCVDREEGSAYWKFNIRLLQLKGHKYGGFGGEFNSPQEAYSAAFDYIKDNSHQYEK